MKATARIRLIEERKRRLWSQQEVADAIGTTQRTVSRWELGLMTPGPYFRAKLCDLFSKRPQELDLLGKTEYEETSSDLPPDTPFSTQDQGVLLWTVPYARNPHFTGRGDLLDRLEQHFSPDGSGSSSVTRRAVLTQPQAIKGLGGIGKTQIAVEYAYRAFEQGRYEHVFWVNAGSSEAIITSLVELAELLPTFPAKEEKDQRKLVAAIKRWLEQCPQRWLFIVDNADDLSLIQEYLPQRGGGSILVTTRANAIGSLAISLEVEQMGLVEGTQFLLHRAQRLHVPDEERNEATNVVITLNGFPLALDQAGAYIEETGCSFKEYLHLYQDHRQTLLARRGRQATNYPDSVATTWSLSFHKVERASPAAAELLQFCAFLSPDHIPEELLQEGAVHWPPALQQAAGNRFTFNQMLEVLLAFSLVKRLHNEQMLSIHRLVQAVQMDTMPPEEQRQWAERMVCAVNMLFPRDPKEEVTTWPQCLRYLEQVQACDALIQQYTLALPAAADLLDRTGIYLREHASYTLAEPLFQRALRIWDELGEAGASSMATSLANLALLYRKQGKYAEAEPLYQKVVHIREHQMGLVHPEVAIALNGLANLYAEQGKYRQAEPLFRQALQIREQHFGPDHPQTSTPLTNLAMLSHLQGKFAQAEPLFQRALQIREQHLGPDHPQVAYTLDGLAILYHVQLRNAEAKPLFQRALQIWEQQLGPEHPQVASPLTGLAEISCRQEKYEEAEALFQRAIRIYEQQLGTDYPQVASPLTGLANLYRAQNKDTEAETLYRRAIGIYEQQVGTDYPDLVVPLTGLADLYRAQGKDEEAEALFRQALSLCERALAPTHPDLAETLSGLAVLREAQERFEEAAALYQRVFTIREQVYGPQHPKTIETRTQYTEVVQAVAREEEATRLKKLQPE